MSKRTALDVAQRTEAAPLFAFGQARGVATGLVAHGLIPSSAGASSPAPTARSPR